MMDGFLSLIFIHRVFLLLTFSYLVSVPFYTFLVVDWLNLVTHILLHLITRNELGTPVQLVTGKKETALALFMIKKFLVSS
jgi:hypothetical protein